MFLQRGPPRQNVRYLVKIGDVFLERHLVHFLFRYLRLLAYFVSDDLLIETLRLVELVRKLV